MTDNDVIETKLEPEVAMLLRENTVLKNWVIGLLDRCEGCTQEAQQWAEVIGAVHEVPANGEVVGEIN